jgi:hypothetical protein
MRSLAPLPFLGLGFLGLAVLAACSNVSPDPGVPHPADPARPPPSMASAAVPAASASPAAGAPSVPSAPRSSAAVTSDAGTDAAASAEEPPLHVKVATIGMHVGGGPYDEITKEPMKRSVEPHFAELARCWKHVAKQQPTDVGVDLVIEAAGGRARVSNPRTFAVGEGFVPCVVAFFEGVDFERPKNGKTVVSYSVRFTP